jgi:hypothetical protein
MSYKEEGFGGAGILPANKMAGETPAPPIFRRAVCVFPGSEIGQKCNRYNRFLAVALRIKFGVL